MSTLTELRARVGVIVGDTGYTAFTSNLIDEAIRQALSDYSTALPRVYDTVIICPAAGREIALDALANLTGVVDVWWPYDSTADEVWPPQRPAGFAIVWDDARPALVLTPHAGGQPQADDEIRIYYTTPHTIAGLDGAGVTTVAPQHEALLVRGAAGYACTARAIALSNTITPNKFAVRNLERRADVLLYGNREHEYTDGFYFRIARLQQPANLTGAPQFGKGWDLEV